ncbi:response regulator transcription factor [Cupriavidus sp. CP313]
MNMSNRSIVYVVDDDESVCLSTYKLLRSAGLHSESFKSPQEFVDFGASNIPSCLLLDVNIHNACGLEFQRAMPSYGLRMPVVFVTGQGDVRTCAKAMKAGAFDFLLKPFQAGHLLDAVNQALAFDRMRLAEEESMASLRAAYNTLTKREREVMALVVSGMMNKQIASEMNLSEITVKGHRGMTMRKMMVKSVADLVRKADALGIGRDRKESS